MHKILAAVAMLMLSGCGANFHSIYRPYDVNPSPGHTTSVLIDAKQRAIISTPQNDPESNRTTFVCAEPSPDALSAISATFAGSFGSTQQDEKLQGALAFAVRETAKQLGTRNATIQLLRDGLYRQCEAYMNGLIGDTTYEQIANKYINAMVVLLAIEEVTPDQRVFSADDGVTMGGETSANAQVNITDNGTAPETPVEQPTGEAPFPESSGEPAPSETTELPQDTENAPETSNGTAQETPAEQPTGDTVSPESSGESAPSETTELSQDTENAPETSNGTAQETPAEQPTGDTVSPESSGESAPSETTELSQDTENAPEAPNDTAQTSAAEASASEPVVTVAPPSNASAEMDDSITAAVSEMTQAFLRKDTVDFCLYTLPRLASSSPESQSTTIVEGFVAVCRLIVTAEYVGGRASFDSIFKFLEQEADQRRTEQEAAGSISEEGS